MDHFIKIKPASVTVLVDVHFQVQFLKQELPISEIFNQKSNFLSFLLQVHNVQVVLEKEG